MQFPKKFFRRKRTKSTEREFPPDKKSQKTHRKRKNRTPAQRRHTHKARQPHTRTRMRQSRRHRSRTAQRTRKHMVCRSLYNAFTYGLGRTSLPPGTQSGHDAREPDKLRRNATPDTKYRQNIYTYILNLL